MTDKAGLTDLARNYPPGSRGLGSLILREYAQIMSARQRGWSWKDIAPAMDLPEGKAKALAEAFRRVHARVEAGQLVAPTAKAAPTPKPPPVAPRTTSANEPFDINSIPRIGERK